jgi:nitrite reductase/ring-hydroxylating ferredoxin subunit
MSVFNVKTGNIVDGPAREPAIIFQVKIEGDQILVNV